MVIHDFYVVGVVLQPVETDAPPIVDANAVLAFPISKQRLQAVAGRRHADLGKLAERDSSMFAEILRLLPLVHNSSVTSLAKIAIIHNGPR